MRTITLALGVLVVMLIGITGAFAVDESICNVGSKVMFYPGGALMQCTLSDDFPANGIKCRQLLTISFYEDGQLDTCTLAERASVGDQDCRAFGPISFYPDGKFKSCYKAEQ